MQIMTRERLSKSIILLSSIAILTITTLPYLRGYLLQTEDRQFLGMIHNWVDTNSYYMWMNQAKEPGLLLKSCYSPADERPIYFNLLWLTLGKTSSALHISLPSLYQATRLLAGILFLWLLYRIICRAFETQLERTFCFFLIVCGSGFGWIWFLYQGDLPFGGLRDAKSVDLWMPEASVFLSMLTFPHIMVAMALFLGILLLALKSWESQRISPAIGAAVCTLIMGFIHPYELLPLVASLFVFPVCFAIAERKQDRGVIISCLLIIAPAFLAIFYYLVLTRFNREFAYAASVNVMRSPTPIYYISGFGLSLPLAVLGLIALFREEKKISEHILMASWLVPTLLMLYGHPIIKFERRLAQGITIPMGILATHGFFTLVVPKIARFSERVLGKAQLNRTPKTVIAAIIMVIIFSVPTNLIHAIDKWLSVDRDSFFVDSATSEAADFLRHRASPRDIVFSTHKSGSYLSRDCYCRIYLGHYGFNPRLLEKSRKVHQFFQKKTSDDQRKRIIMDERLSYVYYGEWERAVGDFDPESVPYLERVFSKGQISIYRVFP